MTKIQLKQAGNDKTRLVQLERDGNSNLVARIDDGAAIELDIDSNSNRGGCIRRQNHVRPFQTARRGDQLFVWLDGAAYSFHIEQRTARRANEAAAAAVGGNIVAPMPGTILKINVAPNDDIEANAAVIVMESMKMEMTLAAPTAATVKEINCKVGQLVEVDQLLATLEPKTDG